jgi:DNA-binding NarL/FixJ family response regulator
MQDLSLNTSVDRRKQGLMTGREREILELISRGFSTNEIARILFLSAETIRSHRKSLLSKLEARNTAQLIRMAFEMRLLT